MDMEILSSNESAYSERYGISLNKRWNRLDHDKYDNPISYISSFDGVLAENTLNFKEDDILRIVIGFGGKNCL